MVRTLHSRSAVVDGEEADPDDGVVVDDAPSVDVVVGAGTLVEVVDDVVELVAGMLEVGVGATATGASPTWESARPTICQVSTVVRTTAVTHASAIFHETMGGIVPAVTA